MNQEKIKKHLESLIDLGKSHDVINFAKGRDGVLLCPYTTLKYNVVVSDIISRILCCYCEKDVVLSPHIEDVTLPQIFPSFLQKCQQISLYDIISDKKEIVNGLNHLMSDKIDKDLYQFKEFGTQRISGLGYVEFSNACDVFSNLKDAELLERFSFESGLFTENNEKYVGWRIKKEAVLPQILQMIENDNIHIYPKNRRKDIIRMLNEEYVWTITTTYSYDFPYGGQAFYNICKSAYQDHKFEEYNSYNGVKEYLGEEVFSKQFAKICGYIHNDCGYFAGSITEVVLYLIAYVLGHKKSGDVDATTNILILEEFVDDHNKKIRRLFGNQFAATSYLERYDTDAFRFELIYSLTNQGKRNLIPGYSCNVGALLRYKMFNIYNLIAGWSVGTNLQPTEASKKAFETTNNKLETLKSLLLHDFSNLRLDMMAVKLHRFIRKDFSSSYLMQVKPQTKAIDKETYIKTIQLYQRLLCLMNPFMPYLSSGIMCKLKDFLTEIQQE